MWAEKSILLTRTEVKMTYFKQCDQKWRRLDVCSLALRTEDLKQNVGSGDSFLQKADWTEAGWPAVYLEIKVQSLQFPKDTVFLLLWGLISSVCNLSTDSSRKPEGEDAAFVVVVKHDAMLLIQELYSSSTEENIRGREKNASILSTALNHLSVHSASAWNQINSL